MTTAIDMGTMTTAGGRPRLFGSTSQLDTSALVEAMVEAKRLPADRLEARIGQNEAKAAAHAEIRGLVDELRTSVASLRNPPGFLGARDNLFERKDVYFSSSSLTSPSSLLGIGAANEAAPGSFEIVVEQLATARKLMADSAPSPTATLAQAFNAGTGFAGTLTLALDDGRSPVAVQVDGDMTIHDLAAAVNAQRSASGVGASVLKVAEGEHRLVLTASETGKEVLLGNGMGDEIRARLGLWSDGQGDFKHSLQAPQGSRVAIDGVTLMRSSNRIDDAMTGITLDLFRAEPGTTVSVEVERSAGAIKEQLVSFVETYNKLRDAMDRYGTLGGDRASAEDAVLYGDSLLRGIRQAVTDLVTGKVDGLDGNAPSTLAGLGITLDGGNRLRIDEARLDARLLDDIDQVRDVLEFRFAASSTELRVAGRSNALGSTSFSVDIVDADGDGVAESASIGGEALEVDGSRLRALPGSAYAGLELVWIGAGTQSVAVTATQGVADRLFNYLGELNERFTSTIDDLNERNGDYRKEIEAIEQRAERLREQMVAKFAALETAMALASSMLQQVRAAMGLTAQES